jgi:hypothetical protein
LSQAQSASQYSLAKTLGIWAAVTAPMAILGWTVAPALAADVQQDPIWPAVTLHSGQSIWFIVLILGVALGLA